MRCNRYRYMQEVVKRLGDSFSKLATNVRLGHKIMSSLPWSRMGGEGGWVTGSPLTVAGFPHFSYDDVIW